LLTRIRKRFFNIFYDQVRYLNSHTFFLIVSLKLQVEQQNAKGAKKLNLNVELEKFHISFLRDQLRCLIKALELISEYQQL
jgi:hypothetical protein